MPFLPPPLPPVAPDRIRALALPMERRQVWIGLLGLGVVGLAVFHALVGDGLDLAFDGLVGVTLIPLFRALGRLRQARRSGSLSDLQRGLTHLAWYVRSTVVISGLLLVGLGLLLVLGALALIALRGSLA